MNASAGLVADAGLGLVQSTAMPEYILLAGGVDILEVRGEARRDDVHDVTIDAHRVHC